MKSRFYLFVFVLSFLALNNAAQAQTEVSDHDAVTATIGHYFEGGAKSNIAEFKKALHPKTFLKFVRKGEYTEIGMPKYYGFYKPGKINERTSQILSIDITGTAAAAKIRIVGKRRIFTDYFTLLKLKEGWKIVSKTSFTKMKE